MKVRALRGVCIGVGRHLSAGDTAVLDTATSQFLISIKAVEEFKDAPVKDETPVDSVPAKTGKKEK